MTDYAREILPEEEKDAEALLSPPRGADPGPVPDPVSLAETVIAAPVEEPVARVTAEVPTAAPIGEKPDPRAPGRHRPVPPEERRAALLVAAVFSLSRQPADAPVDQLLTGYDDAPAHELEHAIRTVVAAVLRAPVAARAPIRDVLARALRRHHETALAKRLAPRLGGIAYTPSRPPAPTEDDG